MGVDSPEAPPAGTFTRVCDSYLLDKGSRALLGPVPGVSARSPVLPGPSPRGRRRCAGGRAGGRAQRAKGPRAAADLKAGSLPRKQVTGDPGDSLRPSLELPGPEPWGPRAPLEGQASPKSQDQGPGVGAGRGWVRKRRPASAAAGTQARRPRPRVCGAGVPSRRGWGADAAPLRRADPGATRAASLWPFKGPPPSRSPRPAARGGGAGEPRLGLAQRAPPPRPPRGGNRQPRLALTSDRLPASDRGLGAKPDLLGLE